MSDTRKFVPHEPIEGEKIKAYQESIKNKQYDDITSSELHGTLQDYYMSKNPTQYSELYNSERGRIMSTDFEDLLSSRNPTESEKNIFPIPINEEDGYLYID